MTAAKKSKSRNVRSEYDQVHNRKAHAKLCLEQPSVLLESMVLRSSSTEPKNGQVVPGPVYIRTQGAEIEFMISLLDPSATERRVGLGNTSPVS